MCEGCGGGVCVRGVKGVCVCKGCVCEGCGGCVCVRGVKGVCV